MNRVRVGVLGTGTVIRSFHLPALLANPRAEVRAIGNLHAASLERLAAEFGIPKSSTDFGRIADDPDIDAVVIGLPNYLHAPVTLKMLQAGKHVLCEKPMATTAADARNMADAADAAGRKLMIAHVWRFSPQVRWLREIVEAGRLGAVERVKAHAIVAGRGPDPRSWFVDAGAAGGGALIDVGIHCIDTISFLFGDRIRPVRVTAGTGNRFQPLAVEDSASVRIEYDNGMAAQLEAGWYHPQAAAPHGAVELFGTEGYARTLPARWEPRAPGAADAERPSFPANHPDGDPSVYAAQMDHFLDCILEDLRPACDGRQGLRDMLVLEAAYNAARSRSSVQPESA